MAYTPDTTPAGTAHYFVLTSEGLKIKTSDGFFIMASDTGRVYQPPDVTPATSYTGDTTP